MSSKLYTAALTGLNCTIVEVETDYRKGNSYFSIVGLADKSIQEARDRIPSAIRAAGAEFVPVKIIMNLAPARLSKSGPSYDLPLAVGYLASSEQIDFDPEGKVFLGELALDGRLRPVSGILPIADALVKKGFSDLFIPFENADEAALVKGLNIFPLKHLKDLIDHFQGRKIIPKYESTFSFAKTHRKYKFDMSQVKGQRHARRALEIAAAGGHNILMSGVPGSGKTMLSRCFPSILPELTINESLEITRIYSVCGLTSKDSPMVTERPFRAPHHTSSQVALVGGGGQIKPGEISLAHRGVLFLDEFPEFSVQALEALRQPLEDKVVTISRASGTLTFPANFVLVAAMNPCKCGYLGDPEKECTCTPVEIARYQKRISGPILDRIDLLINVAKVKHTQLLDSAESESSAEVQKRVQKARDIQTKRFEKSGLVSNSDMSQREIKEFIKLDSETETLLKQAMQRMNLSARSYYRLLKVSRTIADLENMDSITKNHVVEALSYRVEIGG
ncbi:MAG: YifB family Mg chelatase-like AAA ATPase [Candidatus Dojkabacteria bacterium]